VRRLILALVLAACSRTPPPVPKNDVPDATPAPPKVLTPQRFATASEAFRFVLASAPADVIAIGEAHAQRGTETIASSTKRFTETLLPLVAPRASDVVVELWAPDPKCTKEVKAVASAQRPVVEAQAETNQNEYLTLGTRAKAAGMTPWLLRPTCDDFAMLADAGDDAVAAMLGLVKRLTQTKLTQLYQRNRQEAGTTKLVLAYGGALHNDLAPPEATREFSFGPELDQLTGGRYIELDLIVPEFVKKSPTWEKLPWYPAFEAEPASDKTRVFTTGPRSFVLVFPSSG